MTLIFLTHTLAALLAALLMAAPAAGAPYPGFAKHGTHRTRAVGARGRTLEAYNPGSTYTTYGANATLALPPDDDGDAGAAGGNGLVKAAAPEWSTAAMAFVAANLGVDPAGMAWRSGFRHGQDGAAFLRQAYNGIPLANAVANVAFAGGKLVSYGSSFVDLAAARIADATPSISWEDAMPAIEAALGATHNDAAPALEYYAQPDGSLALVHVAQLQSEEGAYVEALVDAHSGALLSVNDFVAHASYRAVPITKMSLADGAETLVDPEDPAASPQGWHLPGTGLESTITAGNNVVALRGADVAAASGAGPAFTADYDDTLSPNVRENAAAALTNAFAALNALHDVAYRYGFTESTFNFQSSNFDRGGRGNDAVRVSVQDAGGVNNANFATPPDGRAALCAMFVWDLTEVERDGAMENDILIHEFSHGITNRMTGGGSGRCLQTVEAGGLGEGWGDMLADWFFQSGPETQDFVVGTYVTGRARGLRSLPYSTDRR